MREADFKSLCEAVALVADREEAAAFLRDIATPAEISAFAERWRIARLLDAGGASYRDIAAKTGASTTTVARVARFLRDENYGGYRRLIDKHAQVNK